MAGEWRTVTIEEIAERVAMGPFGSSIKVETFVSEGVPIISGQHLQGFKVEDRMGYNFITPEHAERLKNAKVQRGDIIFTHAGNIGQVAYVPENSKYDCYVISQRQFYMRPNRSQIIPEFIVSYFKTAEGQHKLLANTSQVGVPSIAQPVTYLRSIEIPLPPLPEQRAIAHILGTLDDKIELNRRMNETLEQMARALFKAWFVDFEPVRAKMEGRWKKGESLPSLPAHLWDLFPDRLVDSELGKIPEAWEVRTFGDEFRITMGQSPPGTSYNEEGIGIPFYQGRVDFGFRFPIRRVFCTEPKRFAEQGDTLVTVRAPVGDLNMAMEYCAIGRGIAALRHNTGSHSYSYYFIHSLKPLLQHFEAEGTVFGAITKDGFNSIRCVVPLRELIERFEAMCNPVDERIEKNERESRTLSDLRDALLPKLISGEIQVKDAERFIEERGL